MDKVLYIIIAIITGPYNVVNVNSIVSNFFVLPETHTHGKNKLQLNKLFIILATPISSPGCEYQFGIYPDSNECSTSYNKCAYGEPIPNVCDAGLVYDERIHGCNWPDLLLEKCNPEAVVGFKCPTKVSPSSPAAKFWPFPRFPVPGDAHRLITCVEGYPRLITCGEEKIFNENTLTCEEP